MITVFTATYNRAALLPRVYTSLLEQTCDDFEWIIVDDGSTDATEQLVALWLSKNIIPIRYFNQVNGGKHRAINKGVFEAKGSLFFIVDIYLIALWQRCLASTMLPNKNTILVVLLVAECLVTV
jgi:glycosyltransferase involved in cell wall biosynthesis